ncbi:MAG: hypothetical protein LBG11_10425 [Bifidobacteriaceae bacterium]|jgi:hypothetical protein|nr:hypothetical protein [Bifidobacteriaceae bacterium]
MVYLRADKPPGHLVRALGLPPRSRVLAAAFLPDAATWLIAASTGFGVAAPERVEFHPWDLIERAKLTREGGLLSIVYADSRLTEEFAIQSRDKRFASIVNECVRTSVVEVEHVDVPGGQVAVALRRRPSDQSLYLQELPGPGVDPAAAKDLVKAARARLGEAAGLKTSLW